MGLPDRLTQFVLWLPFTSTIQASILRVLRRHLIESPVTLRILRRYKEETTRPNAPAEEQCEDVPETVDVLPFGIWEISQAKILADRLADNISQKLHAT